MFSHNLQMHQLQNEYVLRKTKEILFETKIFCELFVTDF